MGRAKGDGMIDFNKYFIVGTNSDALHDTMNGIVTGKLILCKNCKHYAILEDGSNETVCDHKDGCLRPTPDGFCNYAEPKRKSKI